MDERWFFTLILLATLAMVVSMSHATELNPELNPALEPRALWPDQTPPRTARITIHSPPKPNGAAIVICPGGGYGGLAVEPEGHGIARWMNTYGVMGIVLEYELPNGRSLVPLQDARRAIRTVRHNAQQWKLNTNRIGVLGFSAGGHLASTAGTHFDAGDPQANDPVDRESCRPDFMVLIYPVITMGDQTHRGSRRNLLGPSPSAETVLLFSNETQVTQATPSAFLAHAQDDTAVVPANSQIFHEALQENEVSSEYLKLASGGHGLNGYQGPMWDAWQTASVRWLASLGYISRADIPSPVP